MGYPYGKRTYGFRLYGVYARNLLASAFVVYVQQSASVKASIPFAGDAYVSVSGASDFVRATPFAVNANVEVKLDADANRYPLKTFASDLNVSVDSAASHVRARLFGVTAGVSVSALPNPYMGEYWVVDPATPDDWDKQQCAGSAWSPDGSIESSWSVSVCNGPGWSSQVCDGDGWSKNG